MDEDKWIEYAARFVAGLMLAAILMAPVMMCSSCTRTVYVPQTSIQRDSIYITQYKRDSVYMHDSIFQWLKADTMYIEKWHTKYIERLSTDTLYMEKADTLRIPYPVEKQLSMWQQMQIRLCKVFMAVALILCAAYLLYRIKKK
jgi:hypothetical protein